MVDRPILKKWHAIHLTSSKKGILIFSLNLENLRLSEIVENYRIIFLKSKQNSSANTY